MFSLLIFDLDGVVVDTAKFHFLAWRMIANELDIPFDERANEMLKGVSRIESLNTILAIGKKTLTRLEFERLLQEKNNRYLAYIETLTSQDILPGIQNILREARQNKINIALGSASKNAKFILDKLSLTDFFDEIVDGNIVSAAKPNPEVFLHAARTLNADPRQCLVFEDAQSGVIAAKAAHMACIGIGDENQLRQADHVMPGFAHKTLSDIYALYH